MANLIFKHSAMNGGKTINILQSAHSYKEQGLKYIIIKSIKDTKGNDNIVSRVGLESKVDILLDINESLLLKKNYNIYYNAKVIFVDEVEMLSEKQIEELWVIAHKLDIPVITYGLKSNFKGDIFSDGVAKLIAMADDIDEIGSTSLCKCGNKAIFNSRKVNGKYKLTGDIVVIDGTKNVEYVPLCGDCYFKNVYKNAEPAKKVQDLIIEKVFNN